MLETPRPPDNASSGIRSATRSWLNATSSFLMFRAPNDDLLTAHPTGPTTLRALELWDVARPGVKLLSAGALATLLGYQLTSWTCDLSRTQANTSATRAGERPPAQELVMLSSIAMPQAPAATPPTTELVDLRELHRHNEPTAAPSHRSLTGASRNTTLDAAHGHLPPTAATRAASRRSQRQAKSSEELPEPTTDAAASPRPDAMAVAALHPPEPVVAAVPDAPTPVWPPLAQPSELAAEQTRTAPPTPKPRASRPVARALIQNVTIQGGSVPKSSVKHGLKRLQGDLSQCTAICEQAQANAACATSRWHADTVIDETGRSRAPHVQGPTVTESLSACIAKAAGRLSTLAPDTGTVHVSWDMRFVP